MAAVIEDPIRSSVVVLQTLEVMKNEFRRELFNYFNLRMSGDNRASALSFFHMRRELSRILDAIVIRIQTLGPNYHLDNAFRTAIQQEILNVRTAWSTADVRVQADINYIEGLFNTRINNFLVEYNKKQAYSYIFSYSAALNILFYKDPAQDITNEVVAGLNAAYNKSGDKK